MTTPRKDPTLADIAAAAPTIHELLPQVAAAVGAVGKEGHNQTQDYAFRALDDLMNAIHGPLTDFGVTMLPSYTILDRYDRTTRSGNTLEYVIVEGRFRFTGPAGDYAEVVTIGQGSDTSDKACNKAMSASIKYALIQTFAIPTRDMTDADSEGEQMGSPLPPIDMDAALGAVAVASEDTLRRMGATIPGSVTQGRLTIEDASRLEHAIETRLDALDTTETP
jgi:hypothetical protein